MVQLDVHVSHCRGKRGSNTKGSSGRDKHGGIEHRLPLHLGQQDECDGASCELDSGTCSTNNGMKEYFICCYPCCCITAFIFSITIPYAFYINLSSQFISGKHVSQRATRRQLFKANALERQLSCHVTNIYPRSEFTITQPFRRFHCYRRPDPLLV